MGVTHPLHIGLPYLIIRLQVIFELIGLVVGRREKLKCLHFLLTHRNCQFLDTLINVIEVSPELFLGFCRLESALRNTIFILVLQTSLTVTPVAFRSETDVAV